MTAETVLNVANALSDSERERLKAMLNAEESKKSNKEKSKIWNETEVIEKLIVVFQNRKKQRKQ